MNNDSKIKLAILLIIFVPVFAGATRELMPAIALQTYLIFGVMALFMGFAYLYNPSSILGQRIKIGVFVVVLAGLILSMLSSYIPVMLTAEERQYM